MVKHAQRPPGVLVGSSCPYNWAPESHTIQHSYRHQDLCWNLGDSFVPDAGVSVRVPLVALEQIGRAHV